MIIVEGPDGTGKTTLARLISRVLGYDYIKSPGTLPVLSSAAAVIEADPIHKERMFWFNALCPIERIVMDRCYYISEPIYGRAFRGHSSASLEETDRYLKEFISHPGNLIVFCMQFFKHKEEPKSRSHIHLSDEEKVYTEEQATKRHKEIFQAYEDFIDGLSWQSVIRLDNQSQLIEIFKYLKMEKRLER